MKTKWRSDVSKGDLGLKPPPPQKCEKGTGVHPTAITRLLKQKNNDSNF